MRRRKTARKRRGGTNETLRKALIWIGKKLGSFGEHYDNGDFESFDSSQDRKNGYVREYIYKNYRIFPSLRKLFPNWRNRNVKTRIDDLDDA